MLRRVWLLGLLLSVPLVGFGVAEGIRAYLDSQVRASVHRRYPEASASTLSQVTVRLLCLPPKPDTRELCSSYDSLELMSHGSVAAGVVGLALLVVIRVAGGLARNNRSLLVLFKPGLYATLVVLTGLILAHAALAIASIYYLESALENRLHFGIILAIGFGAGAGVLAMSRGAFSLVHKAQTFVLGQSIDRESAPWLWERVDETADWLGALRPENLVLGLNPNFFVTEADVACLSGKLTGRTFYCSLPLCRILSADELTSVIGHELGHFKGMDRKFSERFYPIYRGTATSLASLRSAGKGSRSIALLPAVAVLGYFLECFAVAESRLCRDRELAADAAGAAVTSPTTLAAALVKIHAFSGLWNQLQKAAVVSLREGKAFVNASKVYAEAAARSASPRVLNGIADTRLTHPTDSHPSLSIRLRALQMSISGVTSAALDVTPAKPAIALVPDAEKREESISDAYQVLLARRAGIELTAPAAGSESSV